MSTQEIAEAVMALPEKDRLELARQIVASIDLEQKVSARVTEAVPGIEDVVTGKVVGMTEAEFRNALK
jgi:D-aminopeptidase